MFVLGRVLPIAVLASGYGSNLQALIDACRGDGLQAEIKVVVCNKKSAFALKRAAEAGIRAELVKNRDFASREDHERRILEILKSEGVELVVLAGYMRLLTPVFVRPWYGRLMNIHPALLPAFPGVDSIRRAYEAGVKVTGVTVHFVDEGEDTGPIILQEPVRIEEGMSLEELETAIHAVEHRLIVEAVRLFAEGKIKLRDRKVHIIKNK